MAATLNTGVANKFFKADGRMFQCGAYSYTITDNRIKIYETGNVGQPVVNELVSAIIDGSTGLPFANQAALETWLAANFFFLASSGGGGSQVNSDWNATSGVEEILNKPDIPAAQVNADWNASSGLGEIFNKPSIAPAPSHIAKIADWFDATQLSGYTEGEEIDSWTNLIAGGSDAVPSGTGATYVPNNNGMPGVRFARASSQSMTFTNRAFKQVFFVVNNADGATFADYEGLLSNAGSSGLAIYANAGATGMTSTDSGSFKIQGFATSSNDFFALSKTKIVSVTFPSAIAVTSLRIGGFWNIAGRFWNGIMHEIITFSEPLTKTEYAKVFLDLTAKYRLDKPVLLRAAGNSIMIGGYTGVTTAQSLGNRINYHLAQYFGNNLDFGNEAVGGDTVPQQNFRASNIPGIDFQMDNRTIYGNDFIVFNPGTNDLADAGSGEDCYNDTITFCNNRLKANSSLIIFVLTCFSCEHSSPGHIDEAERIDFNTRLRSMPPNKNIVVIDFADVPLLDETNACDNTDLYDADKIHLNATGQNYAALKTVEKIVVKLKK